MCDGGSRRLQSSERALVGALPGDGGRGPELPAGPAWHLLRSEALGSVAWGLGSPGTEAGKERGGAAWTPQGEAVGRGSSSCERTDTGGSYMRGVYAEHG